MKLLHLSLAAAALILVPALRAERAPAPKAAAFIRTESAGPANRVLQTASTEFRPTRGAGPSVWLVGVAHIGTAEYFQAIQRRLDRQSVVLYEGVGLHDVKQGPEAMKGDLGIQTTLATALGLKFQLNAIDYRRAHFINSDLHAPELQQEVKKRAADAPGAAPDQTMDQLMEMLQGNGLNGGMLMQMVGLLGSTPQMREMTKLLLIEVLGQAGELLDLAKTMSPDAKELLDVILTERNEVVMRDLRAQVARRAAGDTIAIFYGAAHMAEISQHLRDDLGYAPAQTEWDTAFSADATQSGINPAQVQLMLQMLRSQVAPAGGR